MLELEKKGISTTSICVHYWDVCDACVKAASDLGMPNYPWVQLPLEYGIPYDYQPMVKAVEEVAADGIINALTKPLEYVQQKTTVEQISTPGGAKTPTSETMTFTGNDYIDALGRFQQSFDDWGLSGGFVIVPPTKEKVEDMLRGTSHSADEVVMTKNDGTQATVKKIAINAVMAGCKPEHLPVILAVVKAEGQTRGICAMEFNDSPLVLVNGPIIEELALASGMPGPASGTVAKANLAIGRAIRLVAMNIGGSWVDSVSGSGMPRVVAEKETDNPWQPYHVEMGYDAKTSTVTILPITYSAPTSLYTGSVADQKPTCKEIMYAISHGMRGMQNYPTFGALPCVLPLLDSVIMLGKLPAKRIAEDGWSKRDIKEYLWHNTGIRAGELRKGASGVLSYWVCFNKGIYDLDDDVLTPLVRSPGNFHIFVTGSGTGAYFWQGPIQGKIITQSIDDWR